MDDLPLAGFTVAVTAARRREELTALLERRGARVVEAPAIRIVPTGDNDELLATTRACIAASPDVVVVTTGIGFRGWMEAADGWDLGEQLRACFAGSDLMTRGPKAKGAVRAAGLAEAWAPTSESTDEVLGKLLSDGVKGLRVAVQLHGEPLPEFCAALRAAGAEVLEVPVYRWLPTEDVRPARRLVEQIVAGQVDCVTFTSAPAVASLLAIAAEEGRKPAMVAALSGPVLAACVGPVTAGPLERLGIPPCNRPALGSPPWCARSSSSSRPAARGSCRPAVTPSSCAATASSSTGWRWRSRQSRSACSVSCSRVVAGSCPAATSCGRSGPRRAGTSTPSR